MRENFIFFLIDRAAMLQEAGANPAQERCCKDGAVSHGFYQPLEYFWEGERLAMRSKSEYIGKGRNYDALRTQELHG